MQITAQQDQLPGQTPAAPASGEPSPLHLTPLKVERKFLVGELPKVLNLNEGRQVSQGYLAVESGGAEVRILRAENKGTLCVKTGSGQNQARHADGTPAEGHAAWAPHPMQGWTPDFIPKLTGDAIDAHLFDQVVPIAGPDALRCSRDLAQKEGIFVGITAGATLAGALKVAETAPAGSTLVCMLPDTGERYLSTPLFADVPAEMTPAEVEIFHSSPLYADAVQITPPTGA